MPVSRCPLRIDSGRSLTLKIDEARLVVEQFDLRRAAGLEQIDDSLRFGSESAAGRGGLAAGARLLSSEANARPEKKRRVIVW